MNAGTRPYRTATQNIEDARRERAASSINGHQEPPRAEGAADGGSGARPRGIPFMWAEEASAAEDSLAEIVQGVLTAGGMSMIYGESGSGKTTLALHLAFSMPGGRPWLGRQIQRGAVIYVAGEGAASVRRRLRAYEEHHGCRVGPFGLIPTALSLMAGSGDVDALIELVREKQSEIGESVLLVIVDTVARAMPGANENASEDMSRLVLAGDRIREQTGAHLMWVHHSGKDQTRGARGHSSLRAALDTELEVTAEGGQAVHVVAVTKQRDLDSVGQRLAGRFVPVALERNQWGEAVTACVVESADAPASKVQPTRLGTTQQAILAALAGAGRDLRIKELAVMLDAQGIRRTAVYNATERLKDLGMVELCGGIVHLIHG